MKFRLWSSRKIPLVRKWTENRSETIYLRAAQTRAGTTATNQEQVLALPRKRSDGGVSLESDLGWKGVWLGSADLSIYRGGEYILQSLEFGMQNWS